MGSTANAAGRDSAENAREGSFTRFRKFSELLQHELQLRLYGVLWQIIVL